MTPEQKEVLQLAENINSTCHQIIDYLDGKKIIGEGAESLEEMQDWNNVGTDQQSLGESNLSFS